MRILLALALCCSPAWPAVRLKDVASIEGVRDNQLIGYGLVVGLNGTGDKRQTFFSAQSLANLLDRMGIQVSPTAMQVRNTAAVMVTANLPPFAQPGTRVDVQVAAIGDATNLQGGLLLLTPLKSAGGVIYAVGQGSVLTGGFVAGRGGNSTTLNHPTAGRIPNGAIVERAAPSVMPGDQLRLQLRQADFTTATRVAAAVNKKLGADIARCASSGLIEVTLPGAWRSRPVELIAELESLLVEPDGSRRIVVNEKTGTIIIGRDIRIRPVSVLHGALSVQVKTTFDVSQPAPMSRRGDTAVVPQRDVVAKEETAKGVHLDPNSTVEDLARSLQAIGSTPRDIIAILQALQSAGALEAELEVN